MRSADGRHPADTLQRDGTDQLSGYGGGAGTNDALGRDPHSFADFFLMTLNIALLIVGCLMETYSAIVVMVPLIVPLGLHYGVDPVHLGVIFLANLEFCFHDGTAALIGLNGLGRASGPKWKIAIFSGVTSFWNILPIGLRI
jgi:TRAP-type mannitol/chloroaromatic compound transport system permease large subunit